MTNQGIETQHTSTTTLVSESDSTRDIESQENPSGDDGEHQSNEVEKSDTSVAPPELARTPQQTLEAVYKAGEK